MSFINYFSFFFLVLISGPLITVSFLFLILHVCGRCFYWVSPKDYSVNLCFVLFYQEIYFASVDSHLLMSTRGHLIPPEGPQSKGRTSSPSSYFAKGREYAHSSVYMQENSAFSLLISPSLFFFLGVLLSFSLLLFCLFINLFLPLAMLTSNRPWRTLEITIL